MKIDFAKVGLLAGAGALFYWLFKDSKEAAAAATTAPPHATTPAPVHGLAGTKRKKKANKKSKK